MWRNSFISNDESITDKVNVRIKRKSEKQKQIQLTNIHGYVHRTFQSSGFFCVSDSCFIVLSERFSYHPDRKLRLPGDIFDQGKRLLEGSRLQSRFGGTRDMP